jgi:hypothetical protein
MIRTDDLCLCIKEAERFLERCRELWHDKECGEVASGKQQINEPSAKTAAVRRASLDLSKTMAMMRNPWRRKPKRKPAVKCQ